jgi:hypothetical protein
MTFFDTSLMPSLDHTRGKPLPAAYGRIVLSEAPGCLLFLRLEARIAGLPSFESLVHPLGLGG